MKILVVDDDRMVLLDLSKKLQDKGYEVFITDNGVESFRIISEKKIDLVISDVLMPCLSGFTLITVLKNFYYTNIPVILISSYVQESAFLDSQGIQPSNFFHKPIDFEKLLLRIEECAENYAQLA